MLTDTSLYPVNILVNGKNVTKYNHEGDIYIEGRPGSSYEITINNNSYRRIKAVVSVDGLSVIDGNPASENSQGYLVEPYRSTTIKGWRTDHNTENKFVFGDKRKSYSNKTGNGTQNTGVIGVIVFEERDYYTTTLLKRSSPEWYTNYYEPWISCSSAEGSVLRGYSKGIVGYTNDSYSVNNMGTGYGEEVHSPSTEVAFNAKPTPAKRHIIYYDDRKGLEARGIVVDRRKLKPDPFPASNTSFCKRV